MCDKVGDDGKTITRIAVTGGNLGELGWDSAMIDSMSHTLLHFSEMVKILRKYGANLNVRFSDDDRTALHLAVTAQDKPLLEYLLRRAIIPVNTENSLVGKSWSYRYSGTVWQIGSKKYLSGENSTS